MNITMNNVEVSTPFFHENNTAAMNATYETPLATAVSQSEASPVQSEAGPVSPPQDPMEPVVDVIAPPLTPKPYWPSEEPVDTSPIPWRWENRHDMPLEERGRCFFHSIPTNHRPTPTCLLYERDVIDNGTLTCLRSFDYSPEFFSASTRHCAYGNATMRAVENVLDAYRLETCGVVSTQIIPFLAAFYLLITRGWPIFYLIKMIKEENPNRYAILKLFMWFPFIMVFLPFMIFFSNQLEYWFC
jgi:hypothetical protein